MSPKLNEISEAQRKIIHEYNQGKSFAEIGELVNHRRFTIRTIINRGHPPKLTERERVEIVRKATNSRLELKENH